MIDCIPTDTKKRETDRLYIKGEGEFVPVDQIYWENADGSSCMYYHEPGAKYQYVPYKRHIDGGNTHLVQIPL